MSSKHSKFLAHAGAEDTPAHSDCGHSNIDDHQHSHGHSHEHAHNHAEMIRETSGRVLFWCLIATFSFSLVEGMAGYLIHSIALESDAVHDDRCCRFDDSVFCECDF